MALLILAALVYLPFFLLSFLCPKHPHVLNVYFGVPGSGKTTFAAYLTKWALHENALIRFCLIVFLLFHSRCSEAGTSIYIQSTSSPSSIQSFMKRRRCSNGSRLFFFRMASHSSCVAAASCRVPLTCL